MSEQLMQERIRQAEKEISRKRDLVRNSKYRQKYHFMPETGWLNDPNGLIYYQGKYHFFFQFNPYSGFWRYMHWGHAVSEDLLHWEYLPVALAPSEIYDDHEQGGCFSGSAIEQDGKLFLVFTGTSNNGKGFEQSPCVAWSEDGIHFQKYEENPVLTAPEGIPTWFFRDPKVWEHDGIFYMVCGGNRDGRAQALLYKSLDLFHWEFFSVLAEARGEWGYMFECPDFFEINGKYVLVVSPMGAGERSSVYMVGDFDYKTGRFFYTVTGEVDWGYQYYAPASFVAPDGRRIMVAWANCWDWMPFWKDWGPTHRDGWCGFFNIPREVSLNEDLTLSFRPIREIEELRVACSECNRILLEESQTIELEKGYCYEMLVNVDLEQTDAERMVFRLRKSGNQETVITFDFRKGLVLFDVNRSDGWSRGVTKAPLNLIGKKSLDIRIFSDRSSIEVFSNGYTCNLSNNVYTTEENEENELVAEGGKVTLQSLVFYDYGEKSAALI